MTNKNNPTTAFYNGEYLPIDQVCISPFDRGFLLGDSIYEAIPAYQNQMLAGDKHLQRLSEGLEAVGIENPYSLTQWSKICERVIAEDNNQLIYIQVTRGNEQQRKHRFPVEATPTVLVFAIPFTTPFDINYAGCAAHLQTDLRWQRCNVKSTSLMGNILAYRQLYTDGLANDEALLVRDNLVVEAPSSNLFMVKDRVIYTPPLDNILPGVTRALVIELAIKLGFTVQESAPSVAQLMNADEVWVSNSIEELKPITSVDNQLIATGTTGEVWKQLFREFQVLK